MTRPMLRAGVIGLGLIGGGIVVSLPKRSAGELSTQLPIITVVRPQINAVYHSRRPTPVPLQLGGLT